MDLVRIAEVQDQKDKARQYDQALDELLNQPSLADSKIFIEHRKILLCIAFLHVLLCSLC